MREYIRENYKIALALALLLVCVLGLTLTAESQANSSLEEVEGTEQLEVVGSKMQNNYFEYTGNAIEPELVRVVVEDSKGNRMVKTSEDFVINGYSNNVNVGMANIEVYLKEYNCSVNIEDAFYIYPARTTNVQIVNASKTGIDLKWDKALDAAGYQIYRSTDGGENFSLLHELSGADTLSYQDTDIQTNAIYVYYIKTFVQCGEKNVCAKESDKVKQYTPLSTPVLVAVKNASYDSVQIQWQTVGGATNYQIYRCISPGNEYTKIGEVTGTETAYIDTNLECGKNYSYYIKAGQTMEDAQIIYGDASEIKSVKTTPNKVTLNGETTDFTKVDLSWKQSQGAHGYEIYRSTGSSSNYQLVKTIEQGDVLNWTDSGLEKEKEYFYKIRPFCSVDGETVTGSYSGAYEKEIYVNYDYSKITNGNVSVLTQYVGQPYVFGGTTLKGWDCSGFTQWAFEKHYGITLGRTAGEQAGGGKAVSKNDRSSWKPGDLLFYKENGKVSHVAIYLGDGQMIHALSSKYDTLIQDVDYYETWDKKTSLYSVRRYF